MKRKFLLSIILALVFNFVLLINYCQSQWVQTNGVYGWVKALANSGNNIFAGTSSGVYLSTNNGESWNATSLIFVDVEAIAISGANIFVGTVSQGIFLSTNNGTNWNTVNNGLASTYIGAILIFGTNIYAGASNSGLYLSTNNGTNWSLLPGSPANVKSFAILGTNIFAAGGAVYISTNNGTNWTNLNVSSGYVYSLAVSGNYLFAGSHQGLGVHLSTNNGANWWQTASLGSTHVFSLAINGVNLFAGTTNGVYFTQNSGLSWIQKNQGFGSAQIINSLLIANNYIFAGTTDSSVWRRNLSEAIGIKQISEVVPSKYSLTQNYPNPFNPTTNIRFAIPKSSVVKITVFDISGKEVEVLVNEHLQAGTYQTDWDASRYASGVYFYKIQAGDFTETKRMTLIK